MCRSCGCLGKNEARLRRAAPIQGALEAAVLIACAEMPRYGYEIAAWLTSEGLVTGAVSPGRLYETLAELSRVGALVATSEPSEKGPSRRRYRLTESGKARLRAWTTSLERSGVVIARLLSRATILLADVDDSIIANQSDQQEGGERMSCKCNCGGRHAGRGESSEAKGSKGSKGPARSVEDRLSVIETLLETLSNR
jgi:PadR family transcriptional regulator PadR